MGGVNARAVSGADQSEGMGPRAGDQRGSVSLAEGAGRVHARGLAEVVRACERGGGSVAVRGAFQSVIDGFAQPGMRDRRDSNALIAVIKSAQHREEVGGGFGEIAGG